MFFAEGTRSRDGRVKAFQDGAFRLAIETSTPVLPLAVDGTMNALPTQGWTFGRATCRVHVFEPIETAGLSLDDVPDAARARPPADHRRSRRVARRRRARGRRAGTCRRGGLAGGRRRVEERAAREVAALPRPDRRRTFDSRAGPCRVSRCPIAQLAERQFLDLEVQGSIPCRATNGPLRPRRGPFCVSVAFFLTPKLSSPA